MASGGEWMQIGDRPPYRFYPVAPGYKPGPGTTYQTIDTTGRIWSVDMSAELDWIATCDDAEIRHATLGDVLRAVAERR